MRIRTTIAAAACAVGIALSFPMSAHAADGQFYYTYGDGQVGILDSPASQQCITLPEVADESAPPAVLPFNATQSTVTVFAGANCTGDYVTLNPMSQAAPVSQDQAAPVSQGQAAPVSQDQAAPVSQGQVAPVSAQDQAALASQGQVAPVSQGQAAPVSAQDQAALASQGQAAPVSQGQAAPTSQDQVVLSPEGQPVSQAVTVRSVVFS